MTDAIWLYGVQDGAAVRTPVATGVDPARPVERVVHAGLAAVASHVDQERFGADALHDTLRDPDALGAIARAHHDVLGDALRAGPVVPFRICTIYASEDGVRAMLAREHAALADTLERLRGRSEWSVKAYAPAPPATTSAATTGTEYLARKSAGARAVRTLDATVAAVHERLAANAEATSLSPPQDPRLSGRAEEMVLNAAYLVADADGPAFRTLVAELAASLGVPLELSGPWPAYHFSR